MQQDMVVCFLLRDSSVFHSTAVEEIERHNLHDFSAWIPPIAIWELRDNWLLEQMVFFKAVGGALSQCEI
jgi:hypothetical protein